MSRQTKLTPALHTAIVQAVSIGVPFSQAAALAGIDTTTAYQWRQRGEGRHRTRGQTPLYVAFVEAVKKAEAEDEARRIARIGQAGHGGAVTYERTLTFPDGRVEREVKHTAPQWQADAWHLERTRPEVYARQVQRVALTTPDGAEAWQPTVIFLPAQAPSAEEWAQSVQHLLPVNGQHPDES